MRVLPWRQRPPSQRQQEDERLKVAIRAAHSKTRQTYGASRLQAELAAEGFYAGGTGLGDCAVKMGLSCKQKRKFPRRQPILLIPCPWRRISWSGLCADEAQRSLVGDHHIATDEG